MPNWQAASEVWMQRMIEYLEPHICYIAAYNPTEKKWRGKIHTIDLNRVNLLFRSGSKFHVISNEILERHKNNYMKRKINSSSVELIFINFAEVALKYQDIWIENKKKLFVHCHGYDVTWDLRRHESPNIPVFEQDYVDSVRKLSQRATFIANSKVTEQRLLDIGIDEKKIKLKYFGVHSSKYPIKKTDNKKQLKILYIGRLVDCKGPDFVIRAFDLACKMGLNAQLIMAGDGPLRVTCELLKKESKYSDNIYLLGAVDREKAQKLRNDADIFTAHNCKGRLSRQEEAFGVSIIEAMAASLPVITGKNGGVLETVVDRETGILVEPGDIEAHAEAFLKLANDYSLRCSMGKAGWERVKKNFSVENEMRQMLEILGFSSIRH